MTVKIMGFRGQLTEYVFKASLIRGLAEPMVIRLVGFYRYVHCA